MHLSIWQILFLALLQGVTELFPISSLGHTVILPGLLGWGDLVRDQHFLPLIVALHLGTSIALVLYFWRDWYQVGRSLFMSIKQGEIRTGTQEWIGWLILIGCVPAGLLGVALETPLKQLFASPLIAASFLIVNGLALLFGEILRRRAMKRGTSAPISPSDRQKWQREHPPSQQGEWADLPTDKLKTPALSARTRGPVPVRSMASTAPEAYKQEEQQVQGRPLASLTWKDALLIGLAQSLALIPGLSRSGMTMVAGLLVGLSHEDAARYSFLLGTPLISAAAVLEVPQLLGLPSATLQLVLIGMCVAGVAAFLSTRFLLKYFEKGYLYPFAFYCGGAGLLSVILLLTLH